MDFTDILAKKIGLGNFFITVEELLMGIVVIGIAKILLWFIRHLLLDRFFERRNIDEGRRFALKQFISYIIWSLAVFVIIEILHIGSMIWASLAALLVGVGLGLQDVFKDLSSGIVILIEGTVDVGDVIDIDGEVAVVKSIGLRTSNVETRDKINILIPNSKLVVEKVTNWSHNKEPSRFTVRVGVAYGSDLALVRKLILEAAEHHPKVLKKPPPAVQFSQFGDSSLDFTLYFFSREFFRIEFVKSDIRFEIDKLFRENGITIPFPQRDIWIRSSSAGE